MNIHNELQILLDAAKNKNQLDLAFRIIACLAKLKPHTLSINTLSNEDITQLINECASITTHDGCVLNAEIESHTVLSGDHERNPS